MNPKDPTYVANLPLLFVDTETSGLDVERHGLLSIAAVRVTPDAGNQLDSINELVRLAPGLIVDPGAARVNGYTPEKWADAKAESAVMPRLFEMARGAIWVGHNPGFDVAFVSAAFARCGQTSIPLGWKYKIDTATLAWPLLKEGRCSDLKLASVCKALGIKQAAAHTAEDDVMVTVAIYRKLMEQYK